MCIVPLENHLILSNEVDKPAILKKLVIKNGCSMVGFSKIKGQVNKGKYILLASLFREVTVMRAARCHVWKIFKF